MKAKIKFHLKDGERIFVNGAVLRAEGKVSVSLLNDASFLLESYVLQPEQATTPLRQLYFITQSMLISPETREAMQVRFDERLASLDVVYRGIQEAKKLDDVNSLVAKGRLFDALKALKALFVIDDGIAIADALSKLGTQSCAVA